jgi:ribosomal protein S18 acetylase RimI-like enzyme
MTQAVSSRRLAAADATLAAETLARAFANNPGMVWVLPDEARRAEQLRWMMTRYVQFGLRYNECWRIDRTLDGAIVWLPPGKTDTSVVQLLTVGFAFAPWVFGYQGLRNYLRAVELLDGLHDQAALGPHWYLFVIGVEPSRQHRGIGSQLLAPTLARADAASHPCYLETDRPEDVAFYQKHGFHVHAEYTYPSAGPKGWTMIRDPKRGRSTR